MERVEYASGKYPIEHRRGEVERLKAQDTALAEATERLLDRIGVGPGWRCVDLACGPEGITGYLSERVGPGGKVVGLDGDPDFVALGQASAPANVKFTGGDAYATGLEPASFDLVHVRFLASTAGNPEDLVAEMSRLVRPGGAVAAQEADFQTLRCYPPSQAWTDLADIFVRCFPEPGDDPIGHRLYRLFRRAGIKDVGYNPVLVGIRSQDPWRDYMPATVESMRSRIEGDLGVPAARLDDLLSRVREHLADPDTVWTFNTVVQVWGRAPAAA